MTYFLLGKYVIDGQKYRSLSHLVLAYAHLLSTPLEHSLLRDASFFGDISGSEAQELMAGRRLGEYLWRFSSRARFLSLTFVAAEAPTQVRHVLIEELGGGYRVETDSTVHASLAAVVAALTALPIRAAMQHSVWTQPLPPYGAAAASPYEVLVPPAPSPFRNLTDFRAGSYRDLDGDNAGAQPFAPPAAPRVPSPVPDADAVRRTNYAPAPATTATAPAAPSSALGTSPRVSDTGRPVVPQLRANPTPTKPLPSSPPSPGKPPLSASLSGSVAGGGTPDKRNKPDGYVFMLPVTQPAPLSPHARRPDDSPAGSAIGREKSPRLAAAGPADEHYEPLVPAASAAIAVPSQHPGLLPSSSSDSSGSGGGSVGASSGSGGGGLQSPPAARWEGAAPRNKESQRTPVRRGPHSGAQSPPVQNSPPRLVIPQRTPSSEVQWVAMPPLPVPQAPQGGAAAGGRQAANTVSTAWRAIKPSTHAPDAAAAKAPLSSSANPTLTRFHSPGSGAGSGPAYGAGAGAGAGGLSPEPHEPR